MLTAYVPWLRFSTMDFFGSFLCCTGYRSRLEKVGKDVPWFYGICACTCLQFGGTTLVGLLLGQPPSWSLSHTAPRSLLLCYYLVFGFDVFHAAFGKSKILQLFFAVGAALSSGHAVLRGVVPRRASGRDPSRRAETACSSTCVRGRF